MRVIYILIIIEFIALMNSYSEEPFWDSVATPNVGEVRDLDIDNLGNIYIGSRNGLWISSNQGNNWIKILDSHFNEFLFDNSITCDVVSINKDNKLAIMSGKWPYESGSKKVIYSTDLGSSWKKCNISMDMNELIDIEWDNNNTLYVLNQDIPFSSNSIYIYYSKDLDSNWSIIESSFQANAVYDLSILNDSCFAITGLRSDTDNNSILFLTTNKGKSWQEINLNVLKAPCVNYFSNDEIFIGTYRGLKVLKNCKSLESMGPDTIQVRSIYMTNRKDIYLGTNDFIYFSLDSGKSWRQSKNGMEYLGNSSYNSSTGIYNIVRDTLNNLYAETWAWGIFRSSDGGESWQQTNKGFFSAPIYGIAFDKDNNIYLATYGLYKSSNNGKSWVKLGLDGDIFASVFISNKNYIYASSWYSNALFRSKDWGVTWEKITKGLGWSGGDATTLDQIIENKQGYLFATHGGSSVKRSFDDGDSWESVQPKNGSSGIDIAINNENYLFTTGDWAQLLRSINNGDDWDLVFDKLESAYGKRQPILFYPNNQIGYANLCCCLLYTNNNGRVWSDVTEEYGNKDLFYPFFIDSLYNMYWASFDSKMDKDILVRTKQNGEIIDTVPTCKINTIDPDLWVVSPDGYIWCAYNYDGIFRSKQKYVSVKENHIPSDNIILQSSPNPFSESTTINYSLPSPSHVKLSLYDIFGREVAVLVDGWQEAGLHQEDTRRKTQDTRLKGFDIGSGIYFCRLQAGGETKVIKMIRIE